MSSASKSRLEGNVAIVGMSGQFPGARNLSEFWDVIRTGRVCAKPIPAERWNHDLFYSENGGRDHNKTYGRKFAYIEGARDFAPEFFGMTPRRAKVMDPQQRLFLDAVRVAMEDGGYATRPFPRSRTGVFVGATVSDFMDLLTVRMRSAQLMAGVYGSVPDNGPTAGLAAVDRVTPMQAYSMVGTLMNMVAANVSQCFDFGGPSFTTDAACSGALIAVHEAVWQLRAGLIDAAVVGGVFMIFTPDDMVGFSRIGALSPTDSCRPYDGRADGFFIGEGIGAMILRREEDAIAAGDRIHAVIRGVAASSDGKAEGPMTPKREGQLAALNGAYADAGVLPTTIGVLEGHGTATPVGDATEIAAFRDCIGGGRRTECAVTSVKGNIGHSMSAAGIAGLIKATLCLTHRQLSPQAGFGVPRPELELDRVGLHVPREVHEWPSPLNHPRRAGINAFGFGGTNVHVVLEEPTPHRRRRVQIAVPAGPISLESRADEPAPELIVLSAPTPELLRTTVLDLAASLGLLPPDVDLADIAHTLARRRTEVARLAFVARDLADLSERLPSLGAALQTGTAMPVGVFFAAKPRPPDQRRVAFLFPGQGLQAPGMCADLFARFPFFKQELERLTAAAAGLPRPLLSYLYPALEVKPADALADLTATEVCQPAVAAVALTLAKFVRHLGLRPEWAAGHSLGEFAAAADAGVIADDAAAVSFVADRGRLIAGLPLKEPGAMTAVAGDAASVERFVDEAQGVVLANLNHPRQVVISGTESGVAAAEVRLAAAGFRATRLRVSHAFHSPQMQPLRALLDPLVAALPLGPARCTLVSAIRPAADATELPTARAIFADHATARVDFAGAVEVCAKRGANIFVQMGAGSALATMAQATLAGGHDALTMTLSSTVPDRSVTFLGALGQLWVLGIPLDPAGLHDGMDVAMVPALPPSLLDVRPLWPVRAPEPESAAATVALDGGAKASEASNVKRDHELPANANASADVAANGPYLAALAALFQKQVDAQSALLREQNEVLARAAGGGLASATILVGSPVGEDARREWPQVRSSAPAPVLADSAPRANGSHADGGSNGRGAAPESTSRGATGGSQAAGSGPGISAIEARIIDIVARITAHPTTKLGSATRLGSDLGFDSLMVVELMSGLQEALPGVTPPPRSLFANDLSIGDLARHLAQTSNLKTEPRVATAAVRSESLARYAVEFQERTVAAMPNLDSLRGPVVLIADGIGVSAALRRRLESAGLSVEEVSHGLPEAHAGATVVDLRALDAASTPATAGALVGVALRAAELARRLEGARPSALVFAHAGLATAGVPGFGKALAREWLSSRVLSVELDVREGAEAVAERLLGELAGTDTGGEVCHLGGTRLSPVLRPVALPAAVGSIDRGVVVAVTGGAHGLGGRLALELARRHGARLILLGRRGEDAGIKRCISDIQAAGGDARYFSCDVRDATAVAHALLRGRAAFGPIQLAVHAAGVVADGPVGRKDADTFGRVFDTKVAGALSLWNALAKDPVRVFLSFTSWAGRFGNANQTDYSAANHALGRMAVAWAAERVGVRVVALDLPPWQGSSMIAGLPEAIRAEMRTGGVTFVSDEVALPRVVAELATPNAPSGEVLLGANMALRASAALVYTRLSRQSHPYLDDHRLGDRPVLPMAAAADLMLEAARETGVISAGALGQLLDLAVVRGVIATDETTEVVARAMAEERADGQGQASVELLLPGSKSPVAYRARVATAAGWLAPVQAPAESVPVSLPLADFYARHTFHGPSLRSVQSVTSVSAGHVEGVVTAGGSTTDAHTAWLLAVDGALQLCAYWAVVHHGRIGLPLGVQQIRFRAPIPPGARLSCIASLRRADGDRFEGDVDLVTDQGVSLVQMRGLRAELVVGVESPSVDTATYRIEDFPEVKDLRTKIEFARAAGIDIPYFRTLDGSTGATALIDGREYINFTSYNYVGLSGHPKIADEVTAAVKHYGTSVSASRVTGGQKPIHAELEKELASFLGTEDCVVMVGGHATNVSVIGHLLGPEDLVLHDALAHDSILGGARLAGSKRRSFPHNDHQALERILREVRSSVRRVLIAVEGVYSMDGDIGPLPEFIALKKKYGALLFVDEAHSLGVLGATGAGVGEHFGVDRRDVDLWMGTLSKTLASCGGYIAGSAALVEFLKYSVPGFIYSVGMSPTNAAAALAALRILKAEPERARTVQERARYFLRQCHERGIDTGDGVASAVVPCMVGNSYACIRLAEGLLKRGVHVFPIIYPAVQESLARLRFFVTAAHSEEQLRYTADALAEELAKVLPPGRSPSAATHHQSDSEGATEVS